jgi:FMN phosphatase YigB (HAD superfamily)
VEKHTQVVSPFAAILAYEKNNKIPVGWINTAISASGSSGAWAKLERGQIPLDDQFFNLFTSDLCSNEKLWRQFYTKHLAATRRESHGQAAEEATFLVPSPPKINAEQLYWQMMSASRKPDANVWPALQRLRKAVDGGKANFIIAALSNTSIFPAGHEFTSTASADGKFQAELKGVFDLFVSSAHVGMRKPDREIYEYTVAELDGLAKKKKQGGKQGGGGGVKAGDIVFFDDIGTNLRMARLCGMRTFKVELGKSELAVDELERLTGLKLKGHVAAKL